MILSPSVGAGMTITAARVQGGERAEGCYVAGNLCSAIGNGFTLPDKTSASILHDVQRST